MQPEQQLELAKTIEGMSPEERAELEAAMATLQRKQNASSVSQRKNGKLPTKVVDMKKVRAKRKVKKAMQRTSRKANRA